MAANSPTNFSAWGYTGQIPDSIGWGPSGSNAGSLYGYTVNVGTGIWTSPLNCSPYINAAADDTRNQMDYNAVPWEGVYRGPSGTNPTGGFILEKEDAAGTHNYYPVTTQGRFMQYGYHTMMARFTGRAFFINLVAYLYNGF